MSKPVLYLDVDGVLLAYYDGAVQMRPCVNTILREMVATFEVRWLTAWGWTPLQQLLYRTQSTVVEQTSYQDWDSRKVDAIDMSQDFWWLEDEIGDDARCRLYDYQALHRYIYCNPEGQDGLQIAWAELLTRSAANRAPDHK